VTVLLAALLLADPTTDAFTQTATRGDFTFGVEIRPVRVALSGEVHITLTVEGSGPLTVEVSRSDLPGWRPRAAESPVTADLPGGRRRWRQTYRLTPMQVGDVPLSLPAVRALPGGSGEPQEVTWPPVTVRVTTTVPRADVDEARGVTPPEELPPPEPWLDRRFVIGLAAVLVAGSLLALVWWWRQPRPAEPPTPEVAALSDLERLAGIDEFGPAAAADLDGVLRRYLEARYRVPTRERTTAELLREMRQTTRPPEQLDAWQALLERCDLAKFARADFSAAAWAEAIGRARDLVTGSVV
jgi:hypothetical protein